VTLVLRVFKTLVIAGLVLLFQRPPHAGALPVFAHRYALTCQACHTTVPHLNNFGLAFQRNGFRLPGAPVHGGSPLAVKVNVAYSSDAEDGLPKAVVDEVELLTGGTIGRNYNYFLEQYVLDGGVAGRPRDMWVQYNSGNAHIRAGQFTLPLPVDPETERDTEAHYLLYDQTIGENGFAFFDAHTGVEAYTRTPGGLEAHAAVFARGAMAYASQSICDALTLHAYAYRGTQKMALNDDAFSRQGFGVGRSWGKFSALYVVQRGSDSNAGAGDGAASSGDFLETHYVFSPALMAVARNERISDGLSGGQHQTVFSLVMRPARNMRFTVEDQITDHHTLNAAWLFAY
jgi:hypothetical protein